jgi:hypothetical protein
MGWLLIPRFFEQAKALIILSKSAVANLGNVGCAPTRARADDTDRAAFSRRMSSATAEDSAMASATRRVTSVTAANWAMTAAILRKPGLRSCLRHWRTTFATAARVAHCLKPHRRIAMATAAQRE